ncbi:hypothetical protein CLV84_1384 [Neolewinella xylanilytica]|uniref:Uncharacterized protein n=1 Tax=Neolewinella xylanilytica TaxID=1514080 RepID=A0A2S6IA89_9BACT|nr:hypothetical protein [Neolewinella xylanilytica]PPK88417.1 hypothetical protein CLV84_1384 [Neolewinella xylanilytica]
MRNRHIIYALGWAAILLASAYFIGDWEGYPYLSAALLIGFALTNRQRGACRPT